MKNLIILISILLTNFAFGQRGDTHNFYFKVKFDKSIPVDNLQIFYIDKNSNGIINISYETNKHNEIIFKGVNYSVAGLRNYFPTIIFSLKEDKFLNNSIEEVETFRLFYLISKMETYPEEFDKEILFIDSLNPNFIKVDFKWDNNEKVFNVEQVPLNQISLEILDIFPSINTFVKIKQKNK